MGWKKYNEYIRKFLVLISFLVVFTFFSGVVSAANWNVTAGNSIQAAVDYASVNDTIIVYDDNGSGYTYIENVVINKKVNLEAASDLVTVQALNSSKPVFSIYSVGSGSVIQDFMVTGGTGSSGICLNTASGCVITNNRLTNNGNGIFLFNSIGNIYWR